MGSSKKSWRALYAIASGQQGFFTARQAREAGYRDSVHGYHLRNGDWERVRRGIYRLVHYPPSPWPELVVWSLWSRARDGRPQGVFSHRTALQIHGELKRDDAPLHMTVPTRFRKGTALPAELVLHKADLPAGDIEQHEGFLVTTARRARADVRAAEETAGAAAPAAPPRRPPEPAPVAPPPREPERPSGWAVW